MAAKTAKSEQYLTVGRRKTAVARVILRSGSGRVTVNGKPLNEYFPLYHHQMLVQSPLEKTGCAHQYDVLVNVQGGGGTGQAEAIRHGIARALVKINPEFQGPLKAEGWLTRDARMVERKKYGRKKARKRFQFSKR